MTNLQQGSFLSPNRQNASAINFLLLAECGTDSLATHDDKVLPSKL